MYIYIYVLTPDLTNMKIHWKMPLKSGIMLEDSTESPLGNANGNP